MPESIKETSPSAGAKPRYEVQIRTLNKGGKDPVIWVIDTVTGDRDEARYWAGQLALSGLTVRIREA